MNKCVYICFGWNKTRCWVIAYSFIWCAPPLQLKLWPINYLKASQTLWSLQQDVAAGGQRSKTSDSRYRSQISEMSKCHSQTKDWMFRRSLYENFCKTFQDFFSFLTLNILKTHPFNLNPYDKTCFCCGKTIFYSCTSSFLTLETLVWPKNSNSRFTQ